MGNWVPVRKTAKLPDKNAVSCAGKPVCRPQPVTCAVATAECGAGLSLTGVSLPASRVYQSIAARRARRRRRLALQRSGPAP